MQALAAGLEELLSVLTSLVTGLAFSQVRMFGVDVEWAEDAAWRRANGEP